MSVINDKYKILYESMHEDGAFQGIQVKRFKDQIDKLIKSTKSKTLLDYGCGKATSYTRKQIHKDWGVEMPVLYDPYHAPYAERPKISFDGVICTDVLEHIPEPDVNDVLRDIFNYALEFVFLSISTKPAKKTLPNGENAHCTVNPREWWDEKLQEYADFYDVKLHVEYTE